MSTGGLPCPYIMNEPLSIDYTGLYGVMLLYDDSYQASTIICPPLAVEILLRSFLVSDFSSGDPLEERSRCEL
jgi:hypothetical protein